MVVLSNFKNMCIHFEEDVCHYGALCNIILSIQELHMIHSINTRDFKKEIFQGKKTFKCDSEVSPLPSVSHHLEGF